ncbi:hypothetical protein Tco_0645380, partial [Tanacetum coccineum]
TFKDGDGNTLIGYVKTKVSKNSQNRQETEKTSTSEDKRKKYQSRISPIQEKKANEVQGPMLTSFQSSKALLDVLKSKDQN